MTIVKIKNHY